MNENKILQTIYNNQLRQGESIAGLEKTIGDIDKKVTYTNGKVAALMEDKIRREERKKTLEEVQSTRPAPEKQWFEDATIKKLIIAATTVLTIVAGFLTVKGGL